MKNAVQIINTLQYKPQFHKIVEYKCIDRLKSSLLLSIQNSIKYGYIKNNTLYFVMSANLNKLDVDNIINIIKSILNSPMIIESKNFSECKDIKIDDVVCFVDHKPKKTAEIYKTNSYELTYQERATGRADIDIKDEKLKELAQSIFEIIRAKNES